MHSAPDNRQGRNHKSPDFSIDLQWHDTYSIWCIICITVFSNSGYQKRETKVQRARFESETHSVRYQWGFSLLVTRRWQISMFLIQTGRMNINSADACLMEAPAQLGTLDRARRGPQEWRRFRRGPQLCSQLYLERWGSVGRAVLTLSSPSREKCE